MRSEEEAAFLCHIYGMSGQPTYYTLTMDVDYTSRTLIQKEQVNHQYLIKYLKIINRI